MHRDGCMALHGDLTAALGDQSERRLIHRLESVNCYRPLASIRTTAELRRADAGAIALPRFKPGGTRVYCMR